MAGALSGIRVLDLCIILAGPTCGRTLAQYGADVIKIDAAHRAPALTPWLDVGRGKRSICIDLSKDAGLDVFYRLADSADVVLEGFRKGVADRMGIGYEQLKQRNPGIISVSINAFGQDGPWAHRPGFDQNAQAATGQQVRNGGREGTPAPPPYTFNDYGTGLMAAYGVMMALLEREHTGTGQRIETALAFTASTFSSSFLIDYPGFERNEIEGPEARGNNAMSRLYATSDGWIFVNATNDDWESLTELSQFEHLRSRPEFSSAGLRQENDESLAQELSSVFRIEPTEFWTGLLTDAGVSATANAKLSGFFDDDYVRRRGLIVSNDIPGIGHFDHGGVSAQMSKTPPVAGVSPVLGGDTDEVLLEVGYSQQEIDALRSDGIIPPAEGVPFA